ncbi:MAG TPA: hypothetical protein VHV10_10900 [Ktedonobacteraceae bacterium]|jgi:hypothetical protein|nr:hypothetical protein [Ktedonobacteraceae bacterium]
MLDLYEYTTSKGGHGHISGHDADEAFERLTKRGLRDIEKVEPLLTIEDLWEQEAEMRALADQSQLPPDPDTCWCADRTCTGCGDNPYATPGWPPTAMTTVYYGQLMAEPSPF